MKQHVFDSFCDISAHRLMTLSAAEKMDSGGYARCCCGHVYYCPCHVVSVVALSLGVLPYHRRLLLSCILAHPFPSRVELAAAKSWGAGMLCRVLDRAGSVYMMIVWGLNRRSGKEGTFGKAQ